MAGVVYWITGLSGAGKTTIGKLIYEKIKAEKDNVVLLDGDALRNAIAFDLGYSEKDRYESAGRNIKLCKLLADQGIDVVCCTICMFEDIRQWNRSHNENYVEVYLKVPMEILRERNQKNLYADFSEDLVGIGVGMEEPRQPDFVFVNDGSISPEEIARSILERGKRS